MPETPADSSSGPQEAPIFVLRSVLDKAQAADLTAEASDEEKLKKWLEEISPDELGKWTM